MWVVPRSEVLNASPRVKYEAGTQFFVAFGTVSMFGLYQDSSRATMGGSMVIMNIYVSLV